MAKPIHITREMRGIKPGEEVSEVMVGKLPYTEPGREHEERGLTKQEVWAKVHGIYGMHANATAVLFDSPLLRRRRIQRALDEIAKNDSQLNYTACVLLENHGAFSKLGRERQEKEIEKILSTKREELRKALTDNRVENAILSYTNRPRVKMFYRQPYFHTTAGILTSRLAVADAFWDAFSTQPSGTAKPSNKPQETKPTVEKIKTGYANTKKVAEHVGFWGGLVVTGITLFGAIKGLVGTRKREPPKK